MDDITAEALDQVREELYKHEEADERGDGTEACNEVVLFEKIPLVDFLAWLEKHEDDDEVRFWDYEPLTEETGRVVLYYFPTAAQTLAVSGIITEVRKEIVRIGGDEDLSETMLTLPSPTLRFGTYLMAADGALQPRRAFLRGLPTLVVHAAYTESWCHLEKKLRGYMMPATAVQVAIGIKIFRKERRLMIFQRVDDNTFYEDVVDLAGSELGSISIPVQALYHGVAIPTALVGHEEDAVKVDLAWLRGIINDMESEFE